MGRQVEQAKIKRQQELEALAKKKRRHQRVSTKHSSPNDDPLEVKDDDDEPDWIQCFDEWTKRHYYYNVALLQFSYDIPEDPFISAAESSFYKATTTIQNHVRDHLEKRKSSTDTPVPNSSQKSAVKPGRKMNLSLPKFTPNNNKLIS